MYYRRFADGRGAAAGKPLCVPGGRAVSGRFLSPGQFTARGIYSLSYHSSLRSLSLLCFFVLMLCACVFSSLFFFSCCVCMRLLFFVFSFSHGRSLVCVCVCMCVPFLVDFSPSAQFGACHIIYPPSFLFSPPSASSLWFFAFPFFLFSSLFFYHTQ